MAHWIIEDRGFGGATYKCSVCGDIQDDICTNVSLFTECPNCGCPINEEENEYVENTPSKKALMPATIVGIPENRIPETIDIDGNHITKPTSKLAVTMADTMNSEMMKLILEAARKNGITDVVVLDEEFIVTALKNEIERRKETI